MISVDNTKEAEFRPGETIMAGYCQLLTSVVGMGWIWSIYHGMSLVNNASIYSKIKKIQDEPDLGLEDEFGGELQEEE